MSLHATINELASKFAHDLLRALRAASLDELVRETAPGHVRASSASSHTPRAPQRKSGGKRIRRSPEELNEYANRIVALVAKHPKGIRAEDLKRALGIPPGNIGAKVFTKPLAFALASKKLTKRGARRATTYFAA